MRNGEHKDGSWSLLKDKLMSSVSDALKLTLQLTARNKRLEVRASTPRGEGKAETPRPPQALLDQLTKYDLTRIPSSVLESVGRALYRCLMVGDIARLASDVLQDGKQLKQPVHVELRFDPDQVVLAQYPWELITDEFGQFLVRDGLVDVTRYITYPQPPPSFDVAFSDAPLLRVVSQPPQLQSINVTDLPLKRVELLLHATFEQFVQKLLIERLALWGLQFDGHGGLVLQSHKCGMVNTPDATLCKNCKNSLLDAQQISALAFEHSDGVSWISTKEFGSVLYNAKVWLALLLACETGRIGDRLVFGGLAPGLILAGVPAVIGMQYPVLDSFANRFADSFYTILLKSGDILDALRTARRVNILGAWYSPVLYLRHQPSSSDETGITVYHTRQIDTAVPAEVQANVDFLVRLWLRRPETPPLTPEELHDELDVPESVPITVREATAEVKLEAVKGRKLRRGEVEVRLSSPGC